MNDVITLLFSEYSCGNQAMSFALGTEQNFNLKQKPSLLFGNYRQCLSHHLQLGRVSSGVEYTALHKSHGSRKDAKSIELGGQMEELAYHLENVSGFIYNKMKNDLVFKTYSAGVLSPGRSIKKPKESQWPTYMGNFIKSFPFIVICVFSITNSCFL